MLSNVDLEELEAPRFVHALAHLYELDSTAGEKEVIEHRDKVRADIMSKFNGYNQTDTYGMSNDSFGGTASGEPLPYIPLTEQDENGYIGLDPPLN